MNTPTHWLTTARISDTERGAFWKAIFHTDEVPIKSIIPVLATLPGFDEPQYTYMLDLAVITHEQRQRLISALAKKFNFDEKFVAEHIEEGVPILAEGVICSSRDQGLMLSMLDDFDDDLFDMDRDPDDDDHWWNNDDYFGEDDEDDLLS